MSRALSTLLVALSLWVGASQAAVPAPTPGAVQDSLRRPPQTPTRAEPPPVERAPEPAPAARPSASGRTVVVERFLISGNQAVPSAELEAHLANFLARELSIAQLFDAADALTAYYRERGFMLATVVLPAQKVDSGLIRLEVIEGRIGRVLVEGARIYDETRLLDSLEGLEPGSVLMADALEREVLQLNDRPGLEARAVVQPGVDYGTSDLLLRVKETPWTLGITLDNHGRDLIGEHRVLFDGAINSLTGRGDKLAASLLVAEDQLLRYANLAYTMPAGRRGRTLTVAVNRADFEVGGALFAPLGISGDTANYRVDYALPLARGRYANSVLNLAVSRSTSESAIASLNTTSAAAINFAEVSAFWNRIDAKDLSSWTLTATWSGNFRRQDVPTTDPDGIDPGAMRTRLKLDASFSQPFAGRWSFTTRFASQWTPEALPDTQKFSLGGPIVLRAHESSEARGDLGASLGFELQRAGRIGKVPWALALFADSGWVRSEDLVAGGTPVPGTSADLQSGGLGLLWNPGGRLSAHLQYAKALGDYVSATGEDGRFWASLSVKF